jgi:hypothetical protein
MSSDSTQKRYNGLAAAILAATNGSTVCLFVEGTDEGTGHAIATVDPNRSSHLPALLRKLADRLETQLRAGKDRVS